MESMVVLVGVSAVAIATITKTSDTLFGNESEIYVYDEGAWSIRSHGVDTATTTVAPAGVSDGSAIELDRAPGAANTALSRDDRVYGVDLQEVAVASVASGAFRAELFVNGASKGSLYVTQSSADAAAIEGVTLQWSLGARPAGSAAYVTKITSA